MTNIDAPDLDNIDIFNWSPATITYTNYFVDYKNSPDSFYAHNIFKDRDIRL